MPGVVERKYGPLFYVVKVGNGQMWKPHIDHIYIRQCAASLGNESPEEEVSVVYSPTTDIETLEPATRNTQEADQEVQEQPLDYAENRRYPVRYRQPPERYSLMKSIVHACNYVLIVVIFLAFFGVGRSVIDYVIV